MLIEIPANVNSAIEALLNAGFDAYAVGGAVRDCLSGRHANDWDIATSALAQQTKEVFAGKRVIDTGIKHGTVTVIINGEPIEITTFRIDAGYSDNRHPDSVEFTKDICLDLSRRDFTVNAMAYNHRDGLVDIFSSQEDLKNKIIRCVGDPDTRFNEDALRIIRALRFASVLGFSVEECTAESIRKNRLLLRNVAVERTTKELCRLICGINAAKIISEFKEVFTCLVPEFESGINGHAPEIISRCKPCAEHAMAALLLDVPEAAPEVLKRLRLSNKFIALCGTLVKYGKTDLSSLSESEFKKLAGILSEEYFSELLSFQKAVFPSFDESLFSKAKRIFEIGECVSISGLAINGKNVSDSTGAKGFQVGEILSLLLDCVLNEEIPNTVEALTEKAKALYKEKSHD